MKEKETPNIIILKHSKGFVAHVRYEDGVGDKNLSAPTHKALDALIDAEVLGE